MNLDDAVLSHIHEEESLREMWDSGLRAVHLVDPMAGKVLDFAFTYWRDSGLQKAPTSEVLHVEFPSYNEPEGSEESLRWLIGATKDRYANNKLADILEKSAIAIDGGLPSRETLSEVLSHTSNVVANMADRRRISNTADSVMDRRARYMEALEAGGIQGAPLGLTEIDEMSGGIRPGELVALVARLKTGKTFQLVNSYVAAKRAGFTPYFATMELSVPEVEERMDAIISGVSYSRLSSKSLDQRDLNTMLDAQDEFAALGNGFIEFPHIKERTVPHLVTRAQQLGCDYLIIDQMSFIQGREKNYSSITDRYNEIMPDLKTAVADVGIPCLMAAQFNREAERANGGRGSASTIGQSDMIGQTVDMAYGLSRSEEQRINNSAVLEIIASRRTDVDSWMLSWNFTERTEIAVRGRMQELEARQ